MKNSKKLIALVLAMVMIFALTASALAATNATGVTVRVTIKGVINSPTGTNPNATETITLCTAKAITITSGKNKNTVYDLVNTMGYLHSDYPTVKTAAWTPMTVSFMCIYLALVLTPVILDRKEDRQWKSLQSKT